MPHQLLKVPVVRRKKALLMTWTIVSEMPSQFVVARKGQRGTHTSYGEHPNMTSAKAFVSYLKGNINNNESKFLPQCGIRYKSNLFANKFCSTMKIVYNTTGYKTKSVVRQRGNNINLVH